jgi:multimeric flavodoxin WrbA
VTKQLLVIAHAPSKNTQALLQAIEEGTQTASITTVIKSPFESTAQDALDADAILLFTPENLGYMSGAMKDFFDRTYYDVLEEKQGMPVAAIVRAGNDGTGTVRALQTITTGLRWRWVQEPLVLKGEFDHRFLTEAKELTEAIAVALEEGMI